MKKSNKYIELQTNGDKGGIRLSDCKLMLDKENKYLEDAHQLAFELCDYANKSLRKGVISYRKDIHWCFIPYKYTTGKVYLRRKEKFERALKNWQDEILTMAELVKDMISKMQGEINGD